MPDPNRWDTIQSLLHWPDATSLDIIFAVAMHTRFPGDPLWALLVGPSASGKTAIIESMSGHWIARPLDEISTKGFVTGAEHRIEYLRTLNGGLLLIKEFTVMLNASKETADQIFSQLRAIYDGSFTKATGLGVKSITSRFGLLAGCVPQVDVHARLNAAMGDRFLRVEWPVDRVAMVKVARRNSGSDGDIREALRTFSSSLLERSVDIIEEAWVPYAHAAIPIPIENLIDDMAKLMGLLRAQVLRDHMHKVVSMPTTDGGARLAKLLTELVRSLLFLYEDPLPSDEVIDALRRVCYSMIPRARRMILQYLVLQDHSTAHKIADGIRIPITTAREELEDLWMARVIDRDRLPQRNEYRLRPAVRSLLAITEVPLRLDEPDPAGADMTDELLHMLEW